MLYVQEDSHKVIDIQTPNVSPSTQSVGSANSSGGATDLFSNSPIVPINNQWVSTSAVTYAEKRKWSVVRLCQA